MPWTEPDGVDGSDGVNGTQGPIGPQGSQGVQGLTGDTGVIGLIGASGAVGPMGPVGPQGAPFTGPINTDDTTESTSTTTGSIIAAGGVGIAKDLVLGATSTIFVGATANTAMTTGITINMGAADDRVFEALSSDVTHPITDDTDANTFAIIQKSQRNSGGFMLRGFKDSGGLAGQAVHIEGNLGETADTTKTTSATGIVAIDAFETNGGSSRREVAADGNLLVIRTGQTARFIFDTEGDSWQDGGITIGATSKLIFDGSATGDTYIYEESADDLHIVVGGTDYVQIDQDKLSVAKSVVIGGSLDLGSNSLTAGSFREQTIEIQNLIDNTNATVVAGLTGPSGEFNAFTLSVIVRTNVGGPLLLQQDLYWVTTNGNSVTVNPLATDSGGTAGLSYSIAKSGDDLVISHGEIGKTVDVVAAISGLRSVAP